MRHRSTPIFARTRPTLPSFRAPALRLLALAGILAACSRESVGPLAAPDPIPDPARDAQPVGPLPPGEYLFVLNRATRDVSVLAADSGYAEVRRIALPDVAGRQPADLEVASGSGTLYVTFPDSTSTLVALGNDGVERGRIAVPGWSPGLALHDGTGTLAIATGRGVEFVEAANLRGRGRVATGRDRNGAWHVAFTDDGATALVSNSLDDEVVFVSAGDLDVTARVAVSAYPGDLAVANGTAYVAGLHADRLDAISLGQDSVLGSYATGNGPSSVEAPAGSGLVYVATELSGEVTALDAQTGEERGRWAFGHRIPDIALDAAGALLFVCDPSSGRIQVLDAATGLERGAVRVGRSPSVLRAVALR